MLQQQLCQKAQRHKRKQPRTLTVPVQEYELLTRAKELVLLPLRLWLQLTTMMKQLKAKAMRPLLLVHCWRLTIVKRRLYAMHSQSQ